MSEKNSIEKSLESVILGLADGFEREAREKNSEFIAELMQRFEKNEELYECEMSLAFMHFQDFAAMPWIAKNGIVDKKNKGIIGMIYSGLFPHFVRTMIENAEGSPCSADKERFTIRQVRKAIRTGENQSLYADYTGCERISKDKWKEQAYWSPKVFKDTDEVMKAFWKWYRLSDN